MSGNANESKGHMHLFPAPGTDRVLELRAMIALQTHHAFIHVIANVAHAIKEV